VNLKIFYQAERLYCLGPATAATAGTAVEYFPKYSKVD